MRTTGQRPGRPGILANAASIRIDRAATLTQAQADAFKTFMRPVTDAQGSTIYPGSPIMTSPRPMDRRAALGWVVTPAPPADPAAAEPWGAKPPVLWAAAEGFAKSIDLHDPAFDYNNNGQRRTAKSPMKREAIRHAPRYRRHGPAGTPRALFQGGEEAILYHGYGDTAISPFRTVWFYEDLVKAAGGYDKARRACAPFHGARHAPLLRRRRSERFR